MPHKHWPPLRASLLNKLLMLLNRSPMLLSSRSPMLLSSRSPMLLKQFKLSLNRMLPLNKPWEEKAELSTQYLKILDTSHMNAHTQTMKRSNRSSKYQLKDNTLITTPLSIRPSISLKFTKKNSRNTSQLIGIKRELNTYQLRDRLSKPPLK